MLLKIILNTVEKHKSFVYSDARWSKQMHGREIEFDVQARKNTKPICSGCGSKRPGYEELLKNSRRCLLKRPENRTKKQTVKLRELLKYNLRSVKAHLMREDFNRFWPCPLAIRARREHELASFCGVRSVQSGILWGILFESMIRMSWS